MKKHEKEIERVLLNHEKEVLKELEKTYRRALKETQAYTKQLTEQMQKLVQADVENKSLIQSKIYQIEYQKAMQKQINGYLNVLKDEHIATIKDYMKVMYEDSYLTNIYNLHKSGIPVTVPINQELLIKSLTYNTAKIPLSKRLYKNIEDVKKNVISEISRGIATGMSYPEIARNLKNTIGVSRRKANQIAQNEGQRVKTDARLDSMRAAKKKGADIVKVWDATLDGKTRPVHRELDQKHAEIEENFKYSGGEVFAPKQFGIAALDINCRCILLSVPRWDLEDTIQKRDNETGELIEAKNYADWKEKYYNKSGNIGGQEPKKNKLPRDYDTEIAESVGKDIYGGYYDLLEKTKNEDVRTLYSKFIPEIGVGDSKHKGGAYHKSGKLFWNADTDSQETKLRKKFSVFFHEAGHGVDYLLNGKNAFHYYSSAYKNGLFPKTIINEVEDWIERVSTKLKAEFKVNKTNIDWLKENGFISDYAISSLKWYANECGYTLEDMLSGKVKDSRFKHLLPKYSKSHVYKTIEKEVAALTDHEKHALSDILEGATKGKIQAGWGHGKNYWNYIGVEKEAFAEMLESYVSGEESLNTLKKYLPESVKVFEEMIAEATKGG